MARVTRLHAPAGGGAGDQTFLARPAFPSAEPGAGRAPCRWACSRARRGTNLRLCPPFLPRRSRCPEGLAESVPCGREEGSRQTPAPSYSLAAVARPREELPAVPVEGEDIEEEEEEGGPGGDPMRDPVRVPVPTGPVELPVKRETAVFRSRLRLRAGASHSPWVLVNLEAHTDLILFFLAISVLDFHSHILMK